MATVSSVGEPEQSPLLKRLKRTEPVGAAAPDTPATPAWPCTAVPAGATPPETDEPPESTMSVNTVGVSNDTDAFGTAAARSLDVSGALVVVADVERDVVALAVDDVLVVPDAVP